MSHEVPPPLSRPARIRSGEIRGLCYAQLGTELLERAVSWLARGVTPADPELVPLKGDTVFRHGASVLKLFGPGRWQDRLRPAPPFRIARRHETLWPLRTPRPLCALERRRGRRLLGSLLLSELVDGWLLKEAWGRGLGAEERLAPFLAELHGRRGLHGDFHSRNLIWDGEDFVLLDIESLRPFVTRRRRLIRRHWVRLVLELGGDEALRAAFEDYLRRTSVPLHPVRDWEAIRAEGERMRGERRAIRDG